MLNCDRCNCKLNNREYLMIEYDDDYSSDCFYFCDYECFCDYMALCDWEIKDCHIKVIDNIEDIYDTIAKYKAGEIYDSKEILKMYQQIYNFAIKLEDVRMNAELRALINEGHIDM